MYSMVVDSIRNAYFPSSLITRSIPSPFDFIKLVGSEFMKVHILLKVGMLES